MKWTFQMQMLSTNDEYEGREYTETDTDALKRAMAMAMQFSKAQQDQLTSKLEQQPWHEVAEYASYVCQIRTLKLRPWQSPPCDNNEDDPASIKLLDRMLVAGLSQWEPDPLQALKATRR